MPIELNRVDDRLIHGQVVVGWGQPLSLARILLVDDMIASSEWEQELYRMGVPPEMDVQFASVADAAAQWAAWNADPRPAILLTSSIDAMVRLAAYVPALRTVNLGGVHQGAGRAEYLRYLYLTPQEIQQLSVLAERGVEVTARDVPTASPLPLATILAAHSAS